ncbi:hypothetical protein IT072_15960 [Leifsonia sp. ZF2019]|uniref:hypothetical protein n=1 Tax=Leifsonia sp. ZF2019 TaxID=2781978 RepID=UPI001CBB9414|nr:hypothetical protein [Leifsonia sp. ZF2019]UAJ78712.1 hypothetical protein IT072_15960 [Leifsonia sp. ZF2019]
MGEFAVEVGGLRTAARSVDDIADAATPSGDVAHPSTVGDEGLSDAIASFAAKTQRSWAERLAATTALADGLRASAVEYESADGDGRDDVRSAARAY